MTTAIRRSPFHPLRLLAGACLALAAVGGAFAVDVDVQVKRPYNLAYKLEPIDIDLVVKGAEPAAKAIYHIYDFYKNVALQGEFPAGDGAKTVAFTPKKFGWYLVTCDVEKDGKHQNNGSKFIGVTPEFPGVYTVKEGDLHGGWNDEALQAFSGLMLDRTNTTWQGLDKALQVQENADKYGVTLLMQFEGEPKLDHVREAVTKMKGKVKYWEIVNEPNFSHNPQSYAELCLKVAPLIHEIDPKAIVMGCDTCGIDLGWYDGFYKAGGAKVLDAISTHTYEGDNNIDPFHWFWKFAELRKIMAKYGDQDKPLWQTERANGGRVGPLLTAQSQAIRVSLERDILEAIGIPNDHNNHYYAAVTGYEDVATYVFTPSGPYPAALVCRTRQGMIVGKKFAKRLDFGVTGNKLFLGLLYEGADGQAVMLRNYGTLDYPMQVSVTGGDKLEVVDGFGNVEQVPVMAGKANLVVTQLPIYLRLAKGQQVTVPKLDLGKNIAAEATFAYSAGTGDTKPLTDGVFQLWHNQTAWGNPWYGAYTGAVFDESPQTLEMAFGAPRSISAMTIFGEHADNPHCALLDYDLQYHDGKGWVTIEEVRVPCPPTIPAKTYCTEVAAWYLDNNCFIHQFKKPVVTDRLRMVVRRITRGCFIDMIAEDALNVDKPADKRWVASSRSFGLREIEIYKTPNPFGMTVEVDSDPTAAFDQKKLTLTVANRLAAEATGKVTLTGPAGWTMTPAEAAFTVAAGKSASQEVAVAGPPVLPAGKVSLQFALADAGGKAVDVAEAGIAISAPVELTPQKLTAVDPVKQPLAVVVKNLTKAPLSGAVKLVVAQNGKPLPAIEQPFAAIAAGGAVKVDFAVPDLKFDAGTTSAVYTVIANRVMTSVEQNLPSVRPWLLVGPFPNVNKAGFDAVYAPEKGIDVDKPVPAAEAGKELRWKPALTNDGLIDLAAQFNPNSNVCAYGLVFVKSPTARKAKLSAGSDDGIKAWVNGKVVVSNNCDRGAAPGQENVEVDLQAGWNQMLLKITQGGGGWGFYCELQTPDGKPMPDLVYALSAKP